MTTPTISERYSKQILGTLRCFDRLIISGSLPDCCHAGAMTTQLFRRTMRIFDYADLVNPLRNRLHDNARQVAQEAGVTIEVIRKTGAFRKEDRIAEILQTRGSHPGLVHIFSAMESCRCFKPWRDKATGKTTLRPAPGRCSHYYFYFIDECLGLCYLRVPTWAPFRLQFYCNGHSWLAHCLRRERIDFELKDNAFVRIDDWPRAQELADGLDPQILHRRLDVWARKCCPVQDHFPSGQHWSLQQVEYATDLVFRKPEDLAPLYETLTRQAIHEVKVDDIATFLGRPGVHPAYEGEGGSHYNLRIEGTRLRHTLGQTAIKMYDKFGQILRIETTTNEVSFFKHYREVVHRDGSRGHKVAPVQKTIHSLGIVGELMAASNRRYLDFLSALEDDSSGRREIHRVTQPVRDETGRSHRGINFFDTRDLSLALSLVRGEVNISGITVRWLRRKLPTWTGSQLSRAIRRFREHKLLKKVRGTFKYYITQMGRKLILAALRLRETLIIPALT
jgi:hypothetical protein